MRDVFFIQRAAIDILLLNQATAIQICAYLVISKYADKRGKFSYVGFKTIKERLGIGQKKAEEAINALKQMEYDGQRLLYAIDDWLLLNGGVTGNTENVGWVRGRIESTTYKHQVWFSNDLVGCNGDNRRPLHYFVTPSRSDNHARVFLLLHKYANRQYSGVNYRLVSLTSQIESSAQINGVDFYKSKLSDYHFSTDVFRKVGINEPDKKLGSILDELRKGGYFNVSVSAIGNYRGDLIPATQPASPQRKRTTSRKRKISHVPGSRQFEYQYFSSPSTGTTEEPPSNFADIAEETFAELVSPHRHTNPDGTALTPSNGYYGKLVYRLDYKSINKRSLDLKDCKASMIEKLAMSKGLDKASRKGNFYKSYWWFNPGIDAVDLTGLLIPTFTPLSSATGYDQTDQVMCDLASAPENVVKINVVNSKNVSPVQHVNEEDSGYPY